MLPLYLNRIEHYHLRWGTLILRSLEEFRTWWHTNLQAQRMQNVFKRELGRILGPTGPGIQSTAWPARHSHYATEHYSWLALVQQARWSTNNQDEFSMKWKSRSKEPCLKTGSYNNWQTVMQHLMLTTHQQMNHKVSSGLPGESQHLNC